MSKTQTEHDRHASQEKTEKKNKSARQPPEGQAIFFIYLHFLEANTASTSI